MNSRPETDYTPGDDPVPMGTLVEYFGSQGRGRYKIVEVHDPGDHPYRMYHDGDTDAYYPDGVAYDIWPVGVPHKFGNRDQGVYFVRRSSFRIYEKGDRG